MAAPYAAVPGDARAPLTLPTMMIEPLPCSCMTALAACARCSGAVRLSSITVAWNRGEAVATLAGTDLASLRTTARRDVDEYVIDGQKMWTSLIRYADYVWLACRTDPAAPRHRGLSIIIVPTSAPGFS